MREQSFAAVFQCEIVSFDININFSTVEWLEPDITKESEKVALPS